MKNAMNAAVRNSVETGADRRAFGRRETHMPASVRLPNHTYLECIICDISEGGALLEFASPVSISGRLRLSFDGGKQEIISEVRHTRANRVGVQFARNIAIAARPIAMPADAPTPMPAQLRAESSPESGRSNAASELVALRRNTLKNLSAKPELIDQSQATPIVIEIPAAVEPSMPRDISSLLQSVADLAAERAVPRPLPARAYATALAIKPVKAPEENVPRDMSCVLASVRLLPAAGTVPRPLPPCAYALIAA